MRAMPTSEFYRAEADRLRAEARKAEEQDAARSLKLASEYDLLAESMDTPRPKKPSPP